MKTIADLLTEWEARARDALPADAMLINRHIRELREVVVGPAPGSPEWAAMENASREEIRRAVATRALTPPEFTLRPGEVLENVPDGAIINCIVEGKPKPEITVAMRRMCQRADRAKPIVPAIRRGKGKVVGPYFAGGYNTPTYVFMHKMEDAGLIVWTPFGENDERATLTEAGLACC